MKVIVVGVDHSAGASAALAFAEEEAALRGATLRVVHAWQYGYIGYTGFEGGMPAVGGDIVKLQAEAEAALEASVSQADGKVGCQDRAARRSGGAGRRSRGAVAGRRSADRRLARARRIHAAAVGLGQPAVCPPLRMPSRDRAREADEGITQVSIQAKRRIRSRAAVGRASGSSPTAFTTCLRRAREQTKQRAATSAYERRKVMARQLGARYQAPRSDRGG